MVKAEFSANLENLEFCKKLSAILIFTSDICGVCRFQILSVCLSIRLSVHFKTSEYVAAAPLIILVFFFLVSQLPQTSD